MADPQPNTFRRLRYSLEHTIRHAARRQPDADTRIGADEMPKTMQDPQLLRQSQKHASTGTGLGTNRTNVSSNVNSFLPMTPTPVKQRAHDALRRLESRVHLRRTTPPAPAPAVADPDPERDVNRKVTVRASAPPAPRQRTKSAWGGLFHNQLPTPIVIPSQPEDMGTARRRLTSPSSPTLSVPSPPTPPTPSSPARMRPRPAPLHPPSASAFVSSASASTSSSSYMTASSSDLSRSHTVAAPSPAGSRTTSPTPPAPPLKPRPTVSRPPLSPSANANSRLRLRLAGTGSAVNLPLTPTESTSPVQLATNNVNPNPALARLPPERPERRRPSGSGRSTPTTPTTPTFPSHAAPTSASRARAREREREQSLHQYTRSRASASTSSLRQSPPPRTSSDRDRSIRRTTSPSPARRLSSSSPAPAPSPTYSPAYRDTIRHAGALLLRELQGPRPRGVSPSPSSPATPRRRNSSAGPAAAGGWTPDVWDECERRLRMLSRAERLRAGRPFNAANVQDNTNGNTATTCAPGEERDRKVFGEAVRDGYVLCQLLNKLRPGTISRVDAHEDGFRSSTNATKFLAAASGIFGIQQTSLFERDDLLKYTPDALFRVARTITTVVARAEELEAERTAKRILLGQGQSQSQARSRVDEGGGKFTRGSPTAINENRTVSKPSDTASNSAKSNSGSDATNSPYGTRAVRGASASTPNLGIGTRVRRWSPPSPALSTVPAGDSRPGTSSGSGSGATARAGTSVDADGASDADGPQGATTGTGAGVNAARKTTMDVDEDIDEEEGTVEDESALLTDSEDEVDGNDDQEQEREVMKDDLDVFGPRPPMLPPKPAPLMRASLTSQTTQTTNSTTTATTTSMSTHSSLLAASRPARLGSPGISGERVQSAQFGTLRTTTTAATSVMSMGSDMFWEEGAEMNAPNAKIGVSAASLVFRDRRLSETRNVDLSRVAEEGDEEGATAAAQKTFNDEGAGITDDTRGARRVSAGHRPQPIQIQLGKAKWPEDFLTAFGGGSGFPSSSPPRKLAYVGVTPSSAPGDMDSLSHLHQQATAGSGTGTSILAPRRPTHRPRHSVDTASLLSREREHSQSPGPSGSISAHTRVAIRRHSSSARQGVYVPRSDSASPARIGSDGVLVPAGTTPPTPSHLSNIVAGGGDESEVGGESAGTSSLAPRVPFPRAASAEHAVAIGTDAGTSIAAAAGAAAQQTRRVARGRFTSDVAADAGSHRRRARPNSYDELNHLSSAGAGTRPVRPPRARIESMVSLGGASSSNFSASDIRSSLDGSAVRRTLMIREEGRPGTHFQLGNCIGRGQFGSVYRALNLNTGQMVAVKRIRLEGLTEDDVKQLMREVDVVKSLRHPSIVKYEGMSRDSDTLNIVLEFAENGSLGQTLKAFGKLNEKLVATYVIKILEGLHYLHRNDVVHCDLKAANILTTKNGNVKLSDFGVSLNLRNVGRGNQSRNHKEDVTGTPNWMAPEVIELKGASPASDIWSLGCTVIELLTGRPPYAEIQNTMSVMYRIVENPMPPIPDDWSPLLKDFLGQCFRREPTERPSAEVLCEHGWLREYSEIHKILKPKDSIPFLRRVSTDLQKVDAVRFVEGVVDRERDKERDRGREVRRQGSRDSRTAAVGETAAAGAVLAMELERERTPVERGEGSPSPSPNSAVLPGSPPRVRLSTGPATPRSVESELVSPVAREHNFVETSFGKPLLCRVCMQTVKKNAVTCGDCGLIAHARCRTQAPQTCGIRAQLLQFANSPVLDSPQALELIRQFTPSSSPLPDPGTPSADGYNGTAAGTSTVAAGGEGPVHPPTAFRMFGAFRRSRSSLSPEPMSPQTISQDGSNESVVTPAPVSPAQQQQQQRRPALLLKPERLRRSPRPISTGSASDGTPPNRSSLRSAYTGASGSVDLSDESYSQARARTRSPTSLLPSTQPQQRSRPQPIPRGGSSNESRHRRRARRSVATTLGGSDDGETVETEDGEGDVDGDMDMTETEGEHWAASRYSVAASAGADSGVMDSEGRRVSILMGGSSVGGRVSGGTEEMGTTYSAEEMERAHSRRRARRQSGRVADKDKGCVVQ